VVPPSTLFLSAASSSQTSRQTIWGQNYSSFIPQLPYHQERVQALHIHQNQNATSEGLRYYACYGFYFCSHRFLTENRGHYTCEKRRLDLDNVNTSWNCKCLLIVWTTFGTIVTATASSQNGAAPASTPAPTKKTDVLEKAAHSRCFLVPKPLKSIRSNHVSYLQVWSRIIMKW
jgi:hypothetical protein